MPARTSRDTRQSEATGDRRTSRRPVSSPDNTTQPLRGDAAWRAEVKDIARRNEAACAAGARRRAAHNQEVVREAAERDRREKQGLPDAGHR